YETLMQIAEKERASEDYQTLLRLLSSEHTQIWDSLAAFLDNLFEKRNSLLRGKLISPREVLKKLQAAQEQLKNHPIGNAKIPHYHQLFPKIFEQKQLENVCRILEQHLEVFATKNGAPRKQGASTREREWNELMVNYYRLLKVALANFQFAIQFRIFAERFLKTYLRLKEELGQVDYNDMEFLAYKLLTEHPECLNILFAFDEHTDHLLVDEFQDTSFLQWGIIDKLTEEWRSGEGIKPARNITPTIFIVGDDKQSIYMFRDAKVEVFASAAEKLQNWLGEGKLKRQELKENYRSLQAIIDFNNTLFSRLMVAPENSPPWRTRYAPFERKRNNDHPGRVEIILEEFKGSAEEKRLKDSQNVARRIQTLVTEGYEIFERQPDKSEKPRRCKYSDIAILIRNRNYLPALEQALRELNIPFIVVRGTGFYQEKEVRYLLALTSFLVDPGDDLSLYLILRGPFFNIPERELLLATLKTEGYFLFERLQSVAGVQGQIGAAVATLNRWLSRVGYEPLSLIIEDALTERKLYKIFWEPQRQANINKFLRIIQEEESRGAHPLRIRNLLNQFQNEKDESKADVTTIGMNAVQIMTVHNAKGLQFPIVFHPGLHEPLKPTHYRRGDELLIEERQPDEVLVSYIPEKEIRDSDRLFQEYQLKEDEEEKRVFYVACTRAQDALFLTGIWNEKTIKDKTRLKWLKECLNITNENPKFILGYEIPGVTCINASELPRPRPLTFLAKEKPAPEIKTGPIQPVPPPQVRSVTRNTPQDFHRHTGEYIALGEVLHRLLELISLNRLKIPPSAFHLPHSTLQPLIQEILRLFRLNGIPKEKHEEFIQEIKRQLLGLQKSPIWEIVKPQENSYTELPIVFNDGKTIWTGRIDRVIIKQDEVCIYDYKTFPVKRGDIPLLKEEYHTGQLQYYARACEELFPNKVVKTFLIFTHIPLLVPTGD
ncbi:MAG: 3'-5' exonuclease, partial [candidate division WOR-3 bacterium]